jgi:hypothetical protein
MQRRFIELPGMRNAYMATLTPMPLAFAWMRQSWSPSNQTWCSPALACPPA